MKYLCMNLSIKTVCLDWAVSGSSTDYPIAHIANNLIDLLSGLGHALSDPSAQLCSPEFHSKW